MNKFFAQQVLLKYFHVQYDGTVEQLHHVEVFIYCVKHAAE